MVNEIGHTKDKQIGLGGRPMRMTKEKEINQVKEQNDNLYLKSLKYRLKLNIPYAYNINSQIVDDSCDRYMPEEGEDSSDKVIKYYNCKSVFMNEMRTNDTYGTLNPEYNGDSIKVNSYTQEVPKE